MELKSHTSGGGTGEDVRKSRVGDNSAVFEALSNDRRRQVLSYLLEQDEPVGIKELSRVVAAQENDIPADEVTHEQRKRVYIALHQNHLPFLDDASLIECGRTKDDIELTDCEPLLKSYLYPSSERPGPPVTAELGIVVCGSLLVFLRWLAFYPLNLIPELIYAAGILTALTAVIALRLYGV